jgi:hypothetical protein
MTDAGCAMWGWEISDLEAEIYNLQSALCPMLYALCFSKCAMLDEK